MTNDIEIDLHKAVQQPYIEVQITELKYNPSYGDERICKCGHRYHRHFDSYDHMENIGCKYCECYHFEEQIGGGK